MLVRKAVRGDEVAIMGLIHGLAEYENSLHSVDNTAEKLAADLFDHRYCEAFVAEFQNEIVGFALFYTSYSTWKGPCIYLEDLFVSERSRAGGVGSALFQAVVDVAKERKCSRMDWQVLDWNQLAIDFYANRGAVMDGDWLNGRLFFD